MSRSASRRKTKSISKKQVKPPINTDKQYCTMKFEAKYQNRPSPPYAANECCGVIEEGNDGLVYKSIANKIGVCRWVKQKEKN